MTKNSDILTGTRISMYNKIGCMQGGNSLFENKTVEETAAHFGCHIQRGLTEKEASDRLEKNGRNEMIGRRPKQFAEIFFAQLNDPLIYVLIGAAVISVLLKEINDAVIIAVVVVMNAFVGTVQEGKARKALESLKKLTAPRAMVIRDGECRQINAGELVVGDLVCLEAGVQIPADLRLVRTEGLKVEEASLTGESVPVEKDACFTAEGSLPLGDRRNMAYMSTVAVAGRGEGIVVAAGMDTQIGLIAGMIDESPEELTPLQKRLGDLGTLLSVLSLCLCGALFAISVVRNEDPMRMLLTAISLAVAAVPEGLPAVVTICLALSVTRMVKVNTIVRRLPSVETLGAVCVVCSDKTGTLTQNRMHVEVCYFEGKEQENPTVMPGFLEGFLLCNDASSEGAESLGDPTEIALLELGERFGKTKHALEIKLPRIAARPFDSERKMMSTVHRGQDGKTVLYAKGAPEKILEKCSDIRMYGRDLPLADTQRGRILEEVEKMSKDALRTLALAVKTKGNLSEEENMVFLGMAGMQDPLRPEAKEAAEVFAAAGVSTVMITGDHVGTAYAVGSRLGIVTDRSQCMTGAVMEQLSASEFAEKIKNIRVFARVSPAQKVQIVRGFQENGQIVAMTGDGVNDAPSLKAADIGIAMGRSGTDVARQAADMVLTDDNFATIEKAMEEGRSIYENIRKSVIFLLSSNLGEILTMFLAVIFGFAAPLKSGHILWINLITDSLPALALGVDQNDKKSLMKHPPRKAGESLFARGGLMCTCFYGLLITCVSLTAFVMLPLMILHGEGQQITSGALAELYGDEAILLKSQTYAFTVLGMSQLFHAVGMRDADRSVFFRKPLENKLMLIACVFGFCLQFSVTRIPFLVEAFKTSYLSTKEWGLLGILASMPLFAHEVGVIIRKAHRNGV